MRAYCEFRVLEKFAHALFADTEGMSLGNGRRKIILPSDDPRFVQVGRLQKSIRRRFDEFFFLYWELIYRYSSAELAGAELFHFKITAIFEPNGDECGTTYDYSQVCPECGVPRKQTSDLVLDLRKAPKTKDIAGTLSGDEWIVSQRVAELMVDAKLSGFDLGPVRHKARYEDDAMDFRAVPTGREILRRAEAAGNPHPTWQFWCWLNRAEQKELSDRMTAEWVSMRQQRTGRLAKPLPVWYQLIITSPPVRCVAPTRFGIDPFDDDPGGEYRCSKLERDPEGEHVGGLALLSEVSIARDDWDGSDICFARESMGWPYRVYASVAAAEGRARDPALLISPRFRQLLLDHKIKGWRTDVAYLR